MAAAGQIVVATDTCSGLRLAARTRGTTSSRNRGLADRLLEEGNMTAAGIDALGMREVPSRSAVNPNPDGDDAP